MLPLFPSSLSFSSVFQSRISPYFAKKNPQNEFPPRIIALGGRSAHKKYPGYATVSDIYAQSPFTAYNCVTLYHINTPRDIVN